jgi:phosphatidylinositol alpha-1,6-mannosyltransferase
MFRRFCYGPVVRLVLVTQDFAPRRGGIQTWAVELSKRLSTACEAFAVIAPDVPGGREADRELGLRVIRAGTPNTLIAAAAPALARLALSEGFDTTLHAQWSTLPAALGLRAAGKLGRVHSAAHGRELLLAPWQALTLAQQAYDRVRRTTLGSADTILAGSQFTAGLARDLGVSPERVRVTHYGTDPVRFQRRDATALRERLGLGTRPVLLTIARLVSRKGIDTVLAALPKVLAAHPDAVYVVAGDGPDADPLRARARQLGVERAVRFAGVVRDEELSHWYSLADVFVMPSRSDPPDVEGFGIVFLEAAACERPVVAARAGGIPDAVAHGVTGVLVPPGDTPALAAELSALLSDPARCAELGRRGRERVVSDFTWDRVVDRTLSALDG